MFLEAVFVVPQIEQGVYQNFTVQNRNHTSLTNFLSRFLPVS